MGEANGGGRRGRLALVAGVVGAGLAAREVLARRREVELTGEVALVTGGSRGLGFLLARELARAGCRVAICARDAAELERARAALAGEGASVLAVPCDVADPEQVRELVGAVERHFGPVEILINNAGIIQVGPLETMTVTDFQQAMDVMYWGAVYPSLAVLPGMRARHQGRICTISSIGGRVSVPHLLPYAGAKFAAVGFSEGLRADVARDGVSVTTILPGLMRTGSHLNAGFKGRRGQEFTWFSLGASLPLISMDAERAARQIVRAIKRGEAERVLSVPATLLALIHDLLPGLTTDALALVNRLILPDADPQASTPLRGMTVAERYPSTRRDRATRLGRSSADRFHQYPGPRPVAVNGRE